MKANRLSLLIILLFLCSQNATAQTLTTEGNQWNIAATSFVTNNTSSYSIRLSGDTIIEGRTYKIIYHSLDSLNNNWHLLNQYIREDTAKQVYLKEGFSDETLLYDFSLNLGDTFEVMDQCKLVVMEVDTVTLNNGALRRRMKLERAGAPSWGIDYWIEGIGSLGGVLTHFGKLCYFDYSDYLLCHYENEEMVFPANPPSCFITAINELTIDHKISVYPNPAKEVIFIADQSRQNRLEKASVYNSSGALILQKWLEKNLSEVDLTNLSKGLYFLVLETKDGEIYSTKVVKQ